MMTKPYIENNFNIELEQNPLSEKLSSTSIFNTNNKSLQSNLYNIDTYKKHDHPNATFIIQNKRSTSQKSSIST